MSTLSPGVLVRLLHNMKSDPKVAGSHRSVMLQVIGIMPALAQEDELWPHRGFYVKVSDSSHATYVSLCQRDNQLILCDKIQLGQFVYAERLEYVEKTSNNHRNFPRLIGIRPLPGRHGCVGNPTDIDFDEILQRNNHGSEEDEDEVEDHDAEDMDPLHTVYTTFDSTHNFEIDFGKQYAKQINGRISRSSSNRSDERSSQASDQFMERFEQGHCRLHDPYSDEMQRSSQTSDSLSDKMHRSSCMDVSRKYAQTFGSYSGRNGLVSEASNPMSDTLSQTYCISVENFERSSQASMGRISSNSSHDSIENVFHGQNLLDADAASRARRSSSRTIEPLRDPFSAKALQACNISSSPLPVSTLKRTISPANRNPISNQINGLSEKEVKIITNPVSEDVKVRGAYIVPSRYRQSSPLAKVRQGSLPAGASKTRQPSPSGKLVRHILPASSSSSSSKRSVSAGKRDTPISSNRRWSSIHSPASCVKPDIIIANDLVLAQSEKSIDEETLILEGKENVSFHHNKDSKKNESYIQRDDSQPEYRAESKHQKPSSIKKVVHSADVSDEITPIIHDRRWTDGRTPWDTLPPRLRTLGKEVFQKKNVASLKAARALREASAAESVIRCVSMFAELLSLAKPEIPELSMECFFVLYQSLAEVLRVSRSWQLEQEAIHSSGLSAVKNNSRNGGLINATRWVEAALSVDLAPVSLFSNQFGSSCQEVRPSASQTKESENELSETSLSASPADPDLRSTYSSIQASSCTPNKTIQVKMADGQKTAIKYNVQEGRHPSPLKAPKRTMWELNTKSVIGRSTPANGDPLCELSGLQEASDLAVHLRLELQTWFLKYVEETLDSCGSHVACGKDKENQIVCMLSQIKRVNEWVDMVESDKGSPLDPRVVELLGRVKRKVYGFVLENVFSPS